MAGLGTSPLSTAGGSRCVGSGFGTAASSEHDGVGALERGAQGVVVIGLDVEQPGLDPGRLELVGLLLLADEGARLVAGVDELGMEEAGDLARPSDDCDGGHVPSLRSLG